MDYLQGDEVNKVKFKLDESLDDMSHRQKQKLCDILN